MYETVAEITTVIKQKEDDLEELRQQMSGDFDLYTLKEYAPTDQNGAVMTGYQAYTSSQPRNFFDKVTDALNRAELSIQIKLPDDAKEKDRAAAELGELYLFGALNAIDRRLRKRGEPALRETISFLEDLYGWVVIRALVYPQEGETVFDVIPWDFMHTTWESGADGLLWAANKRKVTKGQVLSEYGIEIKGKDTTLIDFWHKEGGVVKNSIIVDNEFVKDPEVTGLKGVPVFIGAVGSMPTMQSKEFESTILHRGDSVWAASRNLYEPFNKITSRTMDLYEKAVIGSILHKSKRGDKSIPGDPYKTYQEVKISSDDEEEILPFPSPEVPTETAILHSIINTDIQTSTLPYPLAYGGTRQAMSGAALSVLADATRSVYNPRTSTQGHAYTWLCEELLTQFKEKGTKSLMQGYDHKEAFFTVKVKPKDIDPSWYVSVSVSPRMPRDMEAEIMMALNATASKGPEDIALVSKRTAREDILKLRDPDAEERKVLEEKGMALPPIMATRVAAALVKAGNKDLAQDVLMLLKPPQQPQPQGMPPQGVPPQGAPPM